VRDLCMEVECGTAVARLAPFRLCIVWPRWIRSAPERAWPERRKARWLSASVSGNGDDSLLLCGWVSLSAGCGAIVPPGSPGARAWRALGDRNEPWRATRSSTYGRGDARRRVFGGALATCRARARTATCFDSTAMQGDSTPSARGARVVLPLRSEASRQSDLPFKWALLNWNRTPHPPRCTTSALRRPLLHRADREVFAIEPVLRPRARALRPVRAGAATGAGELHAPDFRDVGRRAAMATLGSTARIQGTPFTRTWIYARRRPRDLLRGDVMPLTWRRDRTVASDQEVRWSHGRSLPDPVMHRYRPPHRSPVSLEASSSAQRTPSARCSCSLYRRRSQWRAKRGDALRRSRSPRTSREVGLSPSAPPFATIAARLPLLLSPSPGAVVPSRLVVRGAAKTSRADTGKQIRCRSTCHRACLTRPIRENLEARAWSLRVQSVFDRDASVVCERTCRDSGQMNLEARKSSKWAIAMQGSLIRRVLDFAATAPCRSFAEATKTGAQTAASGSSKRKLCWVLDSLASSTVTSRCAFGFRRPARIDTKHSMQRRISPVRLSASEVGRGRERLCPQCVGVLVVLLLSNVQRPDWL